MRHDKKAVDGDVEFGDSTGVCGPGLLSQLMPTATGSVTAPGTVHFQLRSAFHPLKTVKRALMQVPTE